MENSKMWTPSPDQVKSTNLSKLMEQFDFAPEDYMKFHDFSVKNPDQFWSSLFEFFNLQYEGELTPACTDYGFSEYGWFPNVKLSFAENLLAHGADQTIALRSILEGGVKRELNYSDLRGQVGSAAHSLKEWIGLGDVLACYMPNISETVIAMLATNSLGGTFTSTSCDFGIEGVLDRFGQSKPKVLVAAAAYQYNGKTFDLTDRLVQIESELELEKLVVVDFLGLGVDLSKFKNAILWDDLISSPCEPSFTKVSFNHPLYIMYSSGTTGKPKCIVHSVGGTLLQHVKELGLHTNLKKDENMFYFTTCGWMMWNWLVSSLAFGATVNLYEGSPGYPSLPEFFKMIDREKLDYFGTSPKFLKALEDNGWDNDSEFPSLKGILSTGAPLLPEQFDFVYNKIKKDVQLSSICGGTDIIGCFMLGNPNLPVYRGEIQCLGLGMDVSCFSEEGADLIGSEGELVCKKSFPSRPIGFLADENNKRMSSAYFEKFPGVWHHGDFITLTEYGGVSVFGRSDATLNPGGVRIGTAEIYRQTEQCSYLLDSLCVGKHTDGDVEVVLFVKMAPSQDLNEERIVEIKKLIKAGTTPRHVPKHIHAVSDVPYTRSGKKMEMAVARLINGKPLTNIEAVANPECLDQYSGFFEA
jgi:acetoacetyl-CoA synthetase